MVHTLASQRLKRSWTVSFVVSLECRRPTFSVQRLKAGRELGVILTEVVTSERVTGDLRLEILAALVQAGVGK